MKKKILLVFILVLFYSCKKEECNNTNPVFEKYKIDSFEYKDELDKIFKKSKENNIEFYFDKIIQTNDSKKILVTLKSDSICAKFELNVENNEKGLENLIKNKGMGYSGALLKGLKFQVLRKNKDIEFVFESIQDIQD